MKSHSPTIEFKKALIYLEGLLAGKNHKRASFEAGLERPHPALIKDMFPLFLGLKREYKKDE